MDNFTGKTDNVATTSRGYRVQHLATRRINPIIPPDVILDGDKDAASPPAE
jgi:hypothetical protein